MIALLNRLRRDRRGSFAIETAIVVPVLILMTLGTFEVGRMVARQQELQSAANESQLIILATNQGAVTDLVTIESIIRESVDLDANEVTLRQRYRCGSSATLVLLPVLCQPDDIVSSYVLVRITDTYTPIWTHLGLGRTINYNITRRVQVS
jgi:hypothetical protein